MATIVTFSCLQRKMSKCVEKPAATHTQTHTNTDKAVLHTFPTQTHCLISLIVWFSVTAVIYFEIVTCFYSGRACVCVCECVYVCLGVCLLFE